ncbi:stalk domain-containing protein [Paenibacillus azoreducens]|uniref:stalk domain-containing protein n=1 Tax=Paenibacillus azoreducens TaxID=116718 RepID=UPI0039F48CF6
MKKILIGFTCGALFFSGVSYAASGNLTASIANYKLIINGKEKELKNKPVTINGTTYLPLRETSEAVGYSVTLNNGKILLNNGSDASNQPASTAQNNELKSSDLIIVDTLNINVEGKLYGLTMGLPSYVKGQEIFAGFDANYIDLIVSVASNDYYIRESNNDNPDSITAEHFASTFKYLTIIEKQKSYEIKNLQNDKVYKIDLNKESSTGAIYIKEKNAYAVPLNDMFKQLGLNMEAKYEADQKRVVLKFK